MNETLWVNCGVIHLFFIRLYLFNKAISEFFFMMTDSFLNNIEG